MKQLREIKLRIKKVLHDNVLVKIKRQPEIMITKSGLFITGVEQDFYIATVIMVGPGKWKINEDTKKEEFVSSTIEVGDVVVLHDVQPPSQPQNDHWQE